MDEDAIVILIEIRQMVQAVQAIKKVSAEVKNLNKGVADQAKSAKQVTDEIKKQSSAIGKQDAMKEKALARQFNMQGRALARQRAAEQRVDAQTARRIARDNSVMARQSGNVGGTSGGPASRLQSAYTNYQNAMKFGTGTQVFDAQAQLAQAQKAHQQAQKLVSGGGAANGFGGFGSRGGGGAFGSRLRLMAGRNGISARFPIATLAMNPYVLAIAAATIALGAMTKAAADAGVTFAKLGFTAGGNAVQTGQLSVLGGALGADMGEMARQFAETISHGGTAGGFAARAGIHDFGIFDSTNKAQKLLAWLKYLDTLTPDEAKRAARVTGTEGLLGYRTLTQQTKQTLDRDASIKSVVFTPEFAQHALEFQVALGRLGDAFSNLFVTVIGPMLPAITKFINWLADQIQKMVYPDNPAANNALKAREDALNSNTDALRDATAAYAQRNGTYGGGERARNAVPARWSGINTERYISETSRLGAFTF